MCGRFVRFRNWADLRRTLTLFSPSELAPSYNVAPTHNVLVARQIDGKHEGCVMRWGFLPSWAKEKKMMQINARSDSAATKPSFQSAFAKRRCLILADGWYEWIGKQPYFFRMIAEEPMLFAGLWETWRDDEGPVETCAILTTDANELTKEVHDRMPAILAGDEALAWIDPAIEDKDKLTSLLKPFDPDQLTFHAVDTMVGNVKNNSPECIKPLVGLFG